MDHTNIVYNRLSIVHNKAMGNTRYLRADGVATVTIACRLSEEDALLIESLAAYYKVSCSKVIAIALAQYITRHVGELK